MPTLKSHTHLQFAPANAKSPKLQKSMSLPTLKVELKKPRQLTMYKNNSGLITKTKVCKYKKGQL